MRSRVEVALEYFPITGQVHDRGIAPRHLEYDDLAACSEELAESDETVNGRGGAIWGRLNAQGALKLLE